MAFIAQQLSSFRSRATDLIVLTSSFLIINLSIDFTGTKQLLIDLFFYVSIIFICLRLSKRLVFEYAPNSNRILNVLLGNSSGLLLGGMLVLLITQMLPVFQESILVVVFSSIVAFFILGTLSPLVKSSNRDIIRH